jgi:hypothetical protein
MTMSHHRCLMWAGRPPAILRNHNVVVHDNLVIYHDPVATVVQIQAAIIARLPRCIHDPGNTRGEAATLACLASAFDKSLNVSSRPLAEMLRNDSKGFCHRNYYPGLYIL